MQSAEWGSDVIKDSLYIMEDEMPVYMTPVCACWHEISEIIKILLIILPSVAKHSFSVIVGITECLILIKNMHHVSCQSHVLQAIDKVYTLTFSKGLNSI